MGTRWSATLAPIGVRNDDMRRIRFKEGSLSHRSLPMGLLFQREETSAGHDGGVLVGTIAEFGADGKVASGAGELFDDAETERLREDAREFAELAEAGVIGISVDLEPDMDVVIVHEGTEDPFDFENFDFENEDLPELEMLVTRATVMKATAVSGPAFGETLGAITIHREDADADDDVDALVASVIGSTGLPIADRGRSWDGDAASRRMLSAGVDVARRGHFYKDPEGDPETAAAYKLPFADVIDGTLTIVPKGVAAAAGGRGVNAASIPDSEKATIRNKICRIYGRIRAKFDDWPECPFSGDRQSIADALVASLEAPKLPPFNWFANPKLDGPTEISYGADGRVFGHLALDGTCHVGLMEKFGICKVPPDSAVDFAHFNRYAVEVDGGDEIVFAGRLTAGGYHPPLDKSLTAAVQTYDTKTIAAYVVAGRDEYGIWIAGAMQPDLDDSTKQILARHKISGDWRETQDGLELVEVLALQPGPRDLSEPGYPISVHMRGGRQTALVACVNPTFETGDTNGAQVLEAQEIDYDALAAKVVDKMAERTAIEQRRTELAAAIDEVVQIEREQRRAQLAELVGG